MPTLVQHLPLITDLAATAGQGATFTRVGQQLFKDDSGVWQAVSADNAPCFTSKGILLEPMRRNFCSVSGPVFTTLGITATGGMTVATTTETSRLLVNGLQNIITSNNAITIQNSTGSVQTVTISGVTGSTNAHAFSIFAYAQFAFVDVQLSGGKGVRRIPYRNEADPYRRVFSENITGCAGTEQVELILQAGANVRFVLPQLEIGIDANVCGITSPIVPSTAGPTYRYPTNLSFVGSVIPNNNFAVVATFTPTTVSQDGAGANIFDVYGGSSSNRLRLFGPGAANKVTSAADVYPFGRWVPQRDRASTFAVVCGSVAAGAINWSDSCAVYADGAYPMSVPASMSDFAFTSPQVFIGAKNDGTSRTTGWFKDFKVLTGNYTKADSAELSQGYSEITYDVEVRGAILQNPNTPATLYALSGWTGSTFTTIAISTNDGGTWSTVYTLSTPTSNIGLQRDNAGNFYYSSANYLRRIAVSGGAETQVITWNSGPVVAPATRTWSWLPWHWAIAASGALYTTAYTLDGLGGQVIWKSTDAGVTWVKNTSLATQVPSCRHIHSMGIHPAGDKLYVWLGDDSVTRHNFVTAAAVTSWNETSWFNIDNNGWAPGATGMTFTSDAVYASSDTVGGQNYITRYESSNNVESLVYKLPANLNTAPIYFIQAVNDNKLVACVFNEAQSTGTAGAILILEKMSTVSPAEWVCTRMYAMPLTAAGTSLMYYALGHNGKGAIAANSNYIYVQGWNRTAGVPTGTYRISIAETTTTQNTALTTTLDVPSLVAVNAVPVAINSGTNTQVDMGIVRMELKTPKVAYKRSLT